MNTDKLKAAFDTFLDTKVARLNAQHKIAICAAAAVVPILLFVFFIYSPKNKEITGLESRRASLQNEIRKVEAIARELNKYEAEMRDTELKFKAASLLLPSQKEIPSLLTNISGQGTNSGLEILSFSPLKESPREFYAVIPVNLSVRGPYHNVGTFLDKISKLPRIVAVNNVNMGSPTRVDGEMFLNTTLNLVTYRFLEPSNAKK